MTTDPQPVPPIAEELATVERLAVRLHEEFRPLAGDVLIFEDCLEIARLAVGALRREVATAYDRGLAEGRRQAAEGAEHLRRPFFHTEPANGVTLAVTYQGADGLAFVAQPPRAATEPYEQYGVVLPRAVARDLALRMLASVGPWEPDEQPEGGA